MKSCISSAALLAVVTLSCVVERTTAFAPSSLTQSPSPALTTARSQRLVPSSSPRQLHHDRTSATELYMFRRLLRKLGGGGDDKKEEEEEAKVQGKTQQDKNGDSMTTSAADDATTSKTKEPATPPAPKPKSPVVVAKPTEEADICIIGAGVAGLTAALQACEQAAGANKPTKPKVVVLEASPTVGGRVQSDKTADGFILDRGFAVFIEQYPVARELLDYNALQLRPFLPGALVKLPNRFRLARVADPLRVPGDLFTALTAPVGGLLDKLKILPLIWHVRTMSVADLFAETETTTQQALDERWGFSADMQQAFFQPFLQGIYLAPLTEQSSRMFTFVFKMFSEGAATLPTGGMQAVSDQLASRANAAGADIRTGQPVKSIKEYKQDGKEASSGADSYLVKTTDGKSRIRAKSLIVATDGVVAQELIAQLDGFASLENLPAQTQRSVGNLYYSFAGEAPVQDPILILNGNPAQRNTKEYPINNICFPSVVNPSYAPAGKSLCSVTVLTDAMEAYKNDDVGLDQAVRRQLADWFRESLNKEDILDSNKWKLERVYRIPKAQPGQLDGPFPANQNEGRPANVFRGKTLPAGVFVCGDHMATATLNGALESGINAGKEAVKVLQSAKPAAAAAAAAA